MKKKCIKCRRQAVWWYMGSSSSDFDTNFFCDDCVSRGCSCNMKYDDDYEGEDKYDEYLDDKGRRLPCVEFDFSEDGYEDE